MNVTAYLAYDFDFIVESEGLLKVTCRSGNIS